MSIRRCVVLPLVAPAVLVMMCASASGGAGKKAAKSDAVARTAVTLTGEAPAPEGNLVLWYRQPAAAWNHAMPVGNGRLCSSGENGLGVR